MRVVLRLGSPKNLGKSKEPRFVSDAIVVKVKLCCFRIAIYEYLQYVSSLLAYNDKQRQSSVYVMTIRHALYMLDKQNNPFGREKCCQYARRKTVGEHELGENFTWAILLRIKAVLSAF